MWIIVCSIVTRLLIKLYYFLDLLTASVFRFKSKNVFSRGFFLKIMALCMVSIQERVIVARVRYMQNKRFHKFLYLAFCTGLPVVASITSPLMPEWIASMYFNRDSLFSNHSFCNVDAGGCLQQLSSNVISKLLEWTYNEHIICFDEFCNYESTIFFHRIYIASFLTAPKC